MSIQDGLLGRWVGAATGDRASFGAGGPLAIGLMDFSLALTIRTNDRPTTGLGDIAAAFERPERRGFSVGFHHGAPCGNHGNDRNLFFGLDAATEPRWTDHGRPSPETIMVCALAVHDDGLYAATWEGGPSDRGHVYRRSAVGWVDCGAPWDANAVSRLAVHDGRLYAGVSRLRGGGSGMPDSANRGPGGRILRYEGGREWADCGQLEGADSIAGLVPFAGELYAIPMYSEGVFRMRAPGDWVSCGSPGRRLLALGVHAGGLYGAGNDHADVDSAIAQTAAGIVVPARSSRGGGGMFEYVGDGAWTSLGLQPDTTQVYSIETYEDGLFIGTWPNGLVLRHEGDERWRSTGRLGRETEVMNLLAYNGMLYAGTLPKAEVYRFDGDDRWQLVGTLDRTPDVLYRRAASMAVYRGELYCGTLPSGRVHSMRTGAGVTVDRALTGGWHHVVAVRSGGTVALHVDGGLAAAWGDERGETLDLGSLPPLVLGGGPRAAFDGELAEARLYGRALDAAEIADLAVGAS